MSQRILIGVIVVLLVALVVSGLAGGAISGDTLGRFAYAGLVLTLIGSWTLAEMRGNLSESLRNLLIWGVIIAVVAFAYSYKAHFGF